MKTVLEVLQAGAGFLERHGVPQARLNSEHLLAHALGEKRLDLYLAFDRPVPETVLGPLREQMKRRSQGVPLQHLLGTVPFLARDFRCDARALVPRPETEELAAWLCARVRSGEAPAPKRVLDVGTGSGVLAITFALEWPAAEVEASDLSGDALALAAENADALGANVRWHACDLFPEGQAGFDLIVSNPPYIPRGEMEGLPREVRHDPALALDGGADGLDVVRRLIEGARPLLAAGGLLAVELGQGQGPDALRQAREAGFDRAELRPDYRGVERFLLAWTN